MALPRCNHLAAPAACSAQNTHPLAPTPRRSLSLDQRAKVRRAAQAAVGEVLAGLQAAPAPALAQASDAVLKLCQRVLPGPEASAHAAAAAPSKKRQAAEEAIAAAVADALHLLGALKQWLPLLAGAWAGQGCGCGMGMRGCCLLLVPVPLPYAARACLHLRLHAGLHCTRCCAKERGGEGPVTTPCCLNLVSF